jgi:hypothetical protein
MAMLVGVLATIQPGYAIHSTIEDAVNLRNRTIYQAIQGIDQSRTITKSIVLPVSRGFDQGDTGLCWSYAFFSAIETIYQVNHPKSQLEISRGAMQYINMQDRFDLAILGVEDHVNPKKYGSYNAEGGTPLSAEYIMKNYGATTYDDYQDILSPPDYSDIYYAVFADNTTTKQKKATAKSQLSNYFIYEIPENTNFNGRRLTNLAFAKEILPKGKWVTYAISKDDSDYYGQGKDPDRRRNEQTHFIPKAMFIEKIKQSLENNLPIVYSDNRHVTLIYGADFTKNDDILRFYVKDSYESLGYFYKADFKKSMKQVSEVTLLE